MDINKLVLDISDLCIKAFNIVFQKPFLSIKAHISEDSDKRGNIDFKISNDSFGDLELNHIWFITSYNRPLYTELTDGLTPLKVSEDFGQVFSVPVEYLKNLLNKVDKEYITRIAVSDAKGKIFVNRLDSKAQKILSA